MSEAMVQAFTMVDVAAGREDDLCEAIRAIDIVEEAHIIAGDFDLIVELNGTEVREILSTVTEDLRPLDGVGTTKTYICLD